MATNPYIELNPVAWYTKPKKVYQLTRETISDAATYRITVPVYDANNPNAGLKDIGFYFKDHLGHTYTVIAYTSTTIDVEDSFRIGFAPTPDKTAIIYKSVDNGVSPYLAPIFYNKLSKQALEYSRQFELYVLWEQASAAQKPVFNGVCVIPTITDHGDGSITIGDNGHYHLAIIENGHDSDTFLINGGTFTLSDLQQNYIIANYNSGSPVVQHITDVTLINETTIVPIYSIFRNGNFLHIQNWDTLGLALANKVHQSIVKTQRYRREYGLLLTESGTRNLNLTAGRVWVGAVPVSLDAIATSTDNLFFWYHSAGVWTVSVQTQYNNTQYDNGTDLVTLTSDRYAVNWVFRGVESQKHLYVVVGTGDYTLNQAQAATIPTLPTAISSHAVLVSKIIVQDGSNTAVSIQSAFDTQFSAAPTANHTDLTNLAWASSGHTGTANKLAGFGAGGEAIYVTPSSGGASPPTTVSSSTINTDNGTTHTHALDTIFASTKNAELAKLTVDVKGRVTAISDVSTNYIHNTKIRQDYTTIAQLKATSLEYSVATHRNVRFTWYAHNGTESDSGQIIQMKLADNSYIMVTVLANTKTWVTQSFTRDASYIYGQLDFSPSFTGKIAIILETI